MTNETSWPDYYAVTVDRPAWHTVTEALALFAAEDERDGAATPDRADRPAAPRLAVDLGCGAGRDTRELLRNGWRVYAIDTEHDAIDALRSATAPEDLPRLHVLVADIGTFILPPADLINASVSFQFLDEPAYARTFAQIAAALKPGGRFCGLLYGDRDEAASDPAYTCPSPDAIRGWLAEFEIESWIEREEDGKMALGDPHHIHLVEVVARRR